MSVSTTPPGWPILATAASVLILGYGIPYLVDACTWLVGLVRSGDDQLADDFGGDDE